jgi:hypothetical protein
MLLAGLRAYTISHTENRPAKMAGGRFGGLEVEKLRGRVFLNCGFATRALHAGEHVGPAPERLAYGCHLSIFDVRLRKCRTRSGELHSRIFFRHGGHQLHSTIPLQRWRRDDPGGRRLWGHRAPAGRISQSVIIVQNRGLRTPSSKSVARSHGSNRWFACISWPRATSCVRRSAFSHNPSGPV